MSLNLGEGLKCLCYARIPVEVHLKDGGKTWGQTDRGNKDSSGSNDQPKALEKKKSN